MKFLAKYFAICRSCFSDRYFWCLSKSKKCLWILNLR